MVRDIEPETSWRQEIILQRKTGSYIEQDYVEFSAATRTLVSQCLDEDVDVPDIVERVFQDLTPTHVGALYQDKIGILDLDKHESEKFPLDGLITRGGTSSGYFIVPNLTGLKLKISYPEGGWIRSPDLSKKVRLDYTIECDTRLIWKSIVEYFPNLYDHDEQASYLAMTLVDGYVTILGVMRRSIHQTLDVGGLHVGTCSLIHLIDEMISKTTEVDLVVHNSIVDRISAEELSIPLDYFKKGLLSKPFQVSFSSEVSKELDIPDRTTFKLWRLSDWIYFSIKTEGFPVQFHRLNLDDAVRNKRVSTKTIFMALRESLAMKRTGPIDNSRVRKLVEKYRDYSDYNKLLIHLMLNHFPREIDPKDKEMVWSYWDDMAIHRVNILPLLLHLYLARFDPVLRGEIKEIKTSKSPPRKRGGRIPKGPRKYDWGTDKIRYISVPKNKSGSRSPHYVTSHIRNQPISKRETIEHYKDIGVPILKHEDNVCALIYIGSYFKPGSGKIKLNNRGAFYSFGNRPRKYSLMAIEWIKSIEERNSIKIQYATSGGEKRINLGNGNWIFADGYCEENQTIYEFHGDYWHGNPSIYDHEEINQTNKKTFGELHRRTLEREEAIRSCGFNLVSIWESEWQSENSVY